MTAQKLKIKKGDTVVVLAGKDKGKTGEVVMVRPSDRKVTVKGIAMVGRNTKPSQANPEGGIVRKEMPIHVSNVAIVDPKDNKSPSKVGYKLAKDGTKTRIARKSGQEL